MPGRTLVAGNLIPGPFTPATGLGPASAGQVATVVRYPGGIDAPPTFADDRTVLSALWLNFAARIVEAVEAELGPLATAGQDSSTWVAGHKNLRDLLDKVSLAAGGLPAGRAHGFVRFSKTQAASLWAADTIITLDVGRRHPQDKRPVVFAMTRQLQTPTSQILDGPTVVRGSAAWLAGTSLQVRLRGCRVGTTNPGTGGAPVGSAQVTVEGVVVLPIEGAPGR